MFSHSAVLAGSHSSSHTSARIRGFKPNRSTHSIPCKCACAAWVPVRATQRPAPQGWPRGDGDGPLADGRAPGECRAHRAPPERRQRHAARVEPVGRGGPNGGGVALRPPFTPRRSTQSSPRDRKGWGGVGCEERRLGAAPRRRAVARAHLTAGARTGLKRYVVGAVVRGFLVLVAQVLATTPSLEEAMVGGFDRWL